jgi:NAD+ kinase
LTTQSSSHLRRVGVLVHPTRNVAEPLRLLREWTAEHGVELFQIAGPYPQRPVAEDGDAGDTDLIVSIGGDGTTLAALRAGAETGRPVLGIGCGSLGALANVSAADAHRSLDRFLRGEWRPRLFPALCVTRSEGEPVFALNDVALVRESGSQVRVSAYVDGTLFARIAGDGAVVSTPIGTSGYAISAGGPLLLTGIDAYVLTPLPKHGGFAPPLVIGAGSELELDAAGSFGGVRLEVDGQVAGSGVGAVTVSFRAAMATQVTFDDHEPLLTGLRRRGILVDSPRFLAEDARRGLTRPPGT